jgi:hypothetical protein
MFGVWGDEKLSQSTLEDTFNGSVIKLLFNLDEEEKVRRRLLNAALLLMGRYPVIQTYLLHLPITAKILPCRRWL